MPLDNIGGRKFIGLLILATLGMVLVITGHLDPTVYWGAMVANWGLFIYGNAKETSAIASIPDEVNTGVAVEEV
jgi:hypothetical protein